MNYSSKLLTFLLSFTFSPFKYVYFIRKVKGMTEDEMV